MYLNCDRLSFQFQPDQPVLRDISFQLEKGSTLAIVGPSGCGKSTLLRILSSILPKHPSEGFSGTVSIDNKTPDEFRQSGELSFMFQEPALMPNLTVSENVELPLKIRGIKEPATVKNLISLVGLRAYQQQLPKTLSGGMKTRVALARSFITGPSLLLLDEPFSALDIAWKSALYIELEKLREQFQSTIIFVTHDVQEALLLADHVIVLNKQGQMEAQYDLSTTLSISERVADISSYMREVYTEFMLPIQQLLINGRNKNDEKETVFPIA
jgi:NitT/TauT family transport system ATP-binding protein